MKTFSVTAQLVVPVALGLLTTTLTLGALAADRHDRFRHSGTTHFEGIGDGRDRFTEAPTGFDNRTNGLDPQGPAFDTIDEDTVVPLRSFNDNRFIFEEVEGISDGLGPTYNAQSCRECHQNVVTGGASQIAEHRTGRLDASGGFFESLGGSLIHSRATHQEIVERVAFEDDVRTFRISTNTLGAGFIEAVTNETLLAIRDSQPADMRGMAVMVPTPEYANTANLIRTAPLWALRTRNRLMHDGLSFTKQEAIKRHGGQAAAVTAQYTALTDEQRRALMAFLDSL